MEYKIRKKWSFSFDQITKKKKQNNKSFGAKKKLISITIDSLESILENLLFNNDDFMLDLLRIIQANSIITDKIRSAFIIFYLFE